MAEPEFTNAWVELVTAAVQGKYDSVSRGDVFNEVKRTAAFAAGLDTAGQVCARLSPVVDMRSDVQNQTLTLMLIERFWRVSPPHNVVEKIHLACLGKPHGPAHIRETSSVADYSGPALPPPPLAQPALRELELQIHRLAPSFSRASLKRRALFLAHVYSSIIRVHPYADGNGRTARFVAQYLLRMWGDHYVPIPKVRNDLAWRQSLALAIEDDVTPLAEQFKTRMRAASARLA